MGTAIKHPVPDWVKPPFAFVIFDIRALWRSSLSVGVPGCQKLRMTDGLTRSVTGCFIAVPIWQQWASKGYGYINNFNDYNTVCNVSNNDINAFYNISFLLFIFLSLIWCCCVGSRPGHSLCENFLLATVSNDNSLLENWYYMEQF